MFLHDDHRARHAVAETLLGTLLERVVDAGNVIQVYHTASGRHAHNDVTNLLGVVELTLDTQGVGLVTDVKRTARNVAVLGSDERGYRFDTQVIGLHAQGVEINVDFTLGGTGNRY